MCLQKGPLTCSNKSKVLLLSDQLIPASSTCRRLFVKMYLPVTEDSDIAPSVQELHHLFACSRHHGPS